MKRVISILFMLAAFAPHAAQVFSADYDSLPDDAALDAELEWIRAETVVMTKIATKTAMDADLVPGMVTVLRGGALEEQGIRTVYDALSLVPGVSTHISAMGDEHVSVRGLGGSFFSGNLKLMLDGVALNDSLSAGGYVIYQLPVEQIERIEIIRGPGSVIYGEYAYAGVVNVITRKKKNRAYARLDGDESVRTCGGGGTLSYEHPEREFDLTLNISGLKSRGADVTAGEDRLYEGFSGMTFGDFSHSPGPANDARQDRLAALSLGYGNFSLSAQYVLNSRGDHFGVLHVLPSDDDRIAVFHEHQALELTQKMDISESAELEVRAGCRRYEFDTDNIVAMQEISIPLPDGSSMDITHPGGWISAPHYEEEELYVGAELIRRGKGPHTFLLGMKYSDTETEDIWADTNTANGMDRWQGDKNWLLKDRNRRVYSAYLQEAFEMTDHLTLTAGLRYDHYNDMGEYLTPRASAVYRLNDHHIFKAQYSQAVRPPTFTELYSRKNSLIAGNRNLDSEYIRSGELGYIYSNSKTTGRVTLFYSELEDNIEYPKYSNAIGGGGETAQYRNAGDIIKKAGFELEFEHMLRDNLRLGGNLSFTDTDEGETGEPLPGSARWLANLAVRYTPVRDYHFALRHHYVGERHRAPDDDRDKVDAYDTWDLTANIHNLLTEGFTLRGGIRNLFGRTVSDPSPVFKYEDGTVGYNYRDDLPRPGREWWLQLSYDF